MRLARLAALVVLVAPAPAQTVIDFDDAPGKLPPFGTGEPVRPGFIVDGQYLPSGVLFDSGGGGLARCVASNPVSPPNTVTSTQPGPVISYSVPSSASFWLGDQRAVVDYVQLTLYEHDESLHPRGLRLPGQSARHVLGWRERDPEGRRSGVDPLRARPAGSDGLRRLHLRWPAAGRRAGSHDAAPGPRRNDQHAGGHRGPALRATAAVDRHRWWGSGDRVPGRRRQRSGAAHTGHPLGALRVSGALARRRGHPRA